MAKLKITILGSGSSGGVPRVGGVDGRGNWGACDPKNPKNRRRRCSILLNKATGSGASSTDILIDTSPDLREQLLDAGQGRVDHVVYTHAHADQAHGLDDLRALAINMMQRVDVHFDAPTAEALMARFDYTFKGRNGYPAILNAHIDLEPLKPLTLSGEGGEITLLPLDLDHGAIRSLGFRIGDFAYCNDCVRIPEESLTALKGVKTFIVDALRDSPHPTHASVEEALAWIEILQPERAILTNLHVDLDYERLKARLPKGVEPAYDGMVLEVPY